MTVVVGKLWRFSHTLRRDGIDCGDYIEQLAYLLFLKMIEEKGAKVPPDCSRAVLREKSRTGRGGLLSRASRLPTSLLSLTGSNQEFSPRRRQCH